MAKKLVLLMLAAAAFARAEDMAVIVNKSGYTVVITLNELKQMYLGDRGKWPDGKKVIVATLPAESPEFKSALKSIYGMSEADYKRSFIQADFAGKSVTPPKVFDSVAALKVFVAGTPGAIACIGQKDVDDSVRTLRLDGVFPSGAGYKLHVIE